jgi:uncharacterized protein (DUF885 family)
VPGHHFQFARALELPDAPMFRKTAYFVAYGEGWGLYAEQLGYDMGLYDDPYDRFGQLKISELRAKAQRELGPKFDLRAYNDAVLETGSVPLDALEKHIDAWIAAQK